MPSSQSSSRSASEETYHTAEENQTSYAQSPSSDSVYATANQTPTISPDVKKRAASSTPVTVQGKDQVEALRRSSEESYEKREESIPLDATTAPKESFDHSAEAGADVGQQRGLFPQQADLIKMKEEEAHGKLASLTIIFAKHGLVVLSSSHHNETL